MPRRNTLRYCAYNRPRGTNSILKIFRPELDRRAVRGAVGGVVPGPVVAVERLAADHALLGDEPLERRKPVAVIGRAGVGIAGRLRVLDLVAERRRPFRPSEHAAIMQGERQRKSLGLPWLLKHRTFGVARNARHRGGG